MSQIDWSKAPKEATHYDCRKFVSPAFMRKNHNGYDWEFFGEGHWIMYGQLTADQAAKLVARPQPWTGEGLPPVGMVCEFQDGLGGWHQVEITAIARKGICFVEPGRDGENYTGMGAKFRPVRTPEQIAAEARAKAIDDMVKALGMDNPGTSEYIRCGLIYDAGYRKFEITEGE